MVILGLDIATCTGWARLDFDNVGGFDLEGWGVIDCSPEDSEEPEGVRFLRMAERLPQLLDGVDAVVVEQPFSNSYRVAQILYGLTAVALVQLERDELPYHFVHANTLKKWATGNGHASKQDMRDHLESALPSGVEIGEDAVDACWCARWLASHRV